MKCSKIDTHPSHWHTIIADGITVAGGQCDGTGRPPERPADAGTPTSTPAPSQAATEAHSDENEALRAEVERLREVLRLRPERTTVWQDASDEGFRLQVAHAESRSAAALRRAEAAEAQVARVEALASYLDTLAPGDRHYAARIRAALAGPATEEGA